MTNKSIAEDILARKKARHNFKGPIILQEIFSRPSFGGVNIGHNKIEIEANLSYPHSEITRFADPFPRVVSAITEHEICHTSDKGGRGCPKTLELDLEHILNPISKVLRGKGIPNMPYGSQGHTVYTYFGNMFSDIIVNTISSDNNETEGIFLLYEEMGQVSGEFNNLFEGFLKLQSMIFPHKSGVGLLIKYYKQEEIVKEAVRNFLGRTKLLSIPREQRANHLSDENHWKSLSTVFAEEFSKLFNPQDMFLPLMGGNDYKVLDDANVSEKIAMKAYEMSSKSFSPPLFMENNLALLGVYRQLAKRIEIKSHVTTHQSRRPVTHVQTRRFYPLTDDIGRIAYGFNAQGELEEQVGKYPVSVQTQYQKAKGNFSQIRIGLLDCSSSTQESINGEPGKVMNPWAEERMQWTDTSIYHHELLCAFGLWEFFRRKGTLKSAGTSLGLFSNDTRVGKNLKESEVLALHPEFGNTYLYEKDVDDLFRGDNSLIYTISDGGINNWDEVREKFIDNAKRHMYFHLQIGNPSTMSQDLESAGITVRHDDGRNAAGILIDLTNQKVYEEQ